MKENEKLSKKPYPENQPISNYSLLFWKMLYLVIVLLPFMITIIYFQLTSIIANNDKNQDFADQPHKLL